MKIIKSRWALHYLNYFRMYQQSEDFDESIVDAVLADRRNSQPDHPAMAYSHQSSHRARPMSALQPNQYGKDAYGQRFSSRSASGKIQRTIELTQKKTVIDEQLMRTIWRAFGSYIAKQLINGKGVVVPRFGNFTFTATEVSLAGTTNPQLRDKQLREPVFMVGKDFVSAIDLRSGIAHSRGNQIRPLDLKGASGIIPKVKINYVEVGLFCNESKEMCRKACEQMFRNASDRVRKGENVVLEIPLIGRFLTKAKVAAIDFNLDLIDQTRGVTAKQHTVGNLFASANAVNNMAIHKDDQDRKTPNLGQGGAMAVAGGAENWLRQNLDINLDDLPVISETHSRSSKQHRFSSAKLNGRKSLGLPYNGSRGNLHRVSQEYPGGEPCLSEAMLRNFDGRSSGLGPRRSVYSRPQSAATHTTAMASHMSRLPELDQIQVRQVAMLLMEARQSIVKYVSGPSSKYGLRDTLTSTQIYQVMKKCGVFVELSHLKVLLRDLGFQFNGPSASLTVLLSACKAYLHGIHGGYSTDIGGVRSNITPSEFSALSHQNRGSKKISSQNITTLLRDIIYSSKQNLYELFRVGMTGNGLDLEGFQAVIQAVSKGCVPEEDIAMCFKSLQKNKHGKVSFQNFEETFKSEVPSGLEFETKVIRKLREWMYQNSLSSELAFDTLCRAAGKFVEKALSRPAFHLAMSNCEVGLPAVQVDALFSALTTDAQADLTLPMWQSRVYEDGDNPLQMIRELVLANNLSQDDLLFQMKLRVWDNPLDNQAFHTAMRNLDNSISDVQIRALFVSLKNDSSRVPVEALIRNLTGKPYETVDFRNQVYKKLYAEIYPDKEEALISQLQDQDTQNAGLVDGGGLLKVLVKNISTVPREDLERFIRFLDKDKLGMVNYMDFLNKICKASNKNHNPFKSIVGRLSFFLKQNNITANQLLRRLAQVTPNGGQVAPSTLGISVNVFAEFLKQKVEKKRSLGELERYAALIDVDKDGVVTEQDIMTCIKNLSNAQFFKNNGQALSTSTFNSGMKFFPRSNKMSREKALEVCKQIREALGVKKMQYRECFDKFDLDNDGLVSYAEFQRGLDSVVRLSQPIKEQLYALMDKNNIGLISYDQFLEVLRLENIEKKAIEDNFDWETGVIDKLKQWIISQNLTVEEAFKCFDKDFDGFVSKEDLKASLLDILEIDPATVQPTKLDRLFRLMDFFKSGQVQVSDFHRLTSNSNPYSDTKVSGTTKNLSKSLGGGLASTSTFDWKFSAIQQIGLVISRKYPSINDSFNKASQSSAKIQFNKFKAFLEAEQALEGLNLTEALVLRLFSELDPHKKGYLNINDWRNSFKAFNAQDQLLVELKNIISSTFADSDSVFQFFVNFSGENKFHGQAISYTNFENAVNQITAERFKKSEIQKLWRQLVESSSPNSIDRYQFRSHFEDMPYRGTSTIKSQKAAGTMVRSQTASSMGSRTTAAKSRATIQTTTSSSSTWNKDVMERLRVIIQTSPMSLDQIFKDFDQDGNGYISQVEFRNAIRKLGLGLSSRDIDALMVKFDANQDGKIDYGEFMAKFKDTSFDARMQKRAQNRIASLKELMTLHMSSFNDAFRFFDIEKTGRMTFSEFNQLVLKVHELAAEKAPTYPIIKDLFDAIDIRKDGVIDLHEWQQSFGRVGEGAPKLSIKPTALNMWENSRDYMRLGSLMAKSRKLLIEKFKSVLGPDQTLFTFQQGKQALDDWIYSHFKTSVTDEQLRCLFTAAQVHNESQACPKYDYIRLLDIQKSRHSGPQL